MKYRELTPSEIEAYNIGYKVGSRQIVIADVEWESEAEHKIYRKGYLAGCQDRKRHNVDVREMSTMSTMSKPKQNKQCQQCQNLDSDIDIACDIACEKGNSILVSGIRASKFTPPTLQEVIDYAAEQTQWRGVGGFRCPRSVAEEFWAHYDSQGWKKSNDSATPVTNWQSALRLWAKKQPQFEKPQPDLPV